MTSCGRQHPRFVFPTKFKPLDEDLTPNQVFPAEMKKRGSKELVVRYVNRQDPKQMLVYIHGACKNSGWTYPPKGEPRAAYAFVYKPAVDGCISMSLPELERLQNRYDATNNRAELWAAVRALCHRHWEDEEFTSIVLATDSEYIFRGATEWAPGWIRNRWKGESGLVRNQDLWEILLEEVAHRKFSGLNVQFWKIKRQANQAAFEAAHKAAGIDVPS
ncbi:hypothetical protein E4U17_006133 [Claviceps sp. LM77 group G4]|nr:hypothetical protein E4U17_006133 [Claviceps sp. LM77 group G4]KAG6082121.1 hypothetical protein E4U33_006026 [Claviceps sp. LM78 group G4]KAG6083012.1 hypothetical protein E4U16_005032 [Claviceps sp. LM84 group G4]